MVLAPIFLGRFRLKFKTRAKPKVIWRQATARMHKNPHLGEGRSCRRSAMAPFERAMVVSYRFSVVATAITIRLQFVVECLRRSSQQGVVHFGAKFGDEGLTDVRS